MDEPTGVGETVRERQPFKRYFQGTGGCEKRRYTLRDRLREHSKRRDKELETLRSRREGRIHKQMEWRTNDEEGASKGLGRIIFFFVPLIPIGPCPEPASPYIYAAPSHAALGVTG
jgi:hypothetical protein